MSNSRISSFSQALRGLVANPARTVLTTLGIVIGIATVIVVLSAGAGFNSLINAQLQSFGANSITVETRVPPSTRDRQNNSGSANTGLSVITTLKSRDVESIRRIANISDAYGAVLGQKTVAYQNVSKNAFVFGADASRFAIDTGKLKSGRFYTDQENSGASQVVILGADIATDLFGDADPIGKTIRIGTYNFQVIGVYERRGSFGFSNDDQQVFIPLLTAQKKVLGVDYLFFILAQAKDPDLAEATAADMRAVIRQNHDITDEAKDDFAVNTQAGNLDTFNTILAGVTFLLIAIAAISLLVGGVGIMNIMYVVVTERISEIGLKKAIGARSGDILKEFLIESVLLTLLGGVLGILFGAGISWLISLLAQNFGLAWAFSVPIYAIVISVGVAGGIGLVFGVFPARRAAKMDPIEALRSE